MRFRHHESGDAKIDLQMTPMIDIVFQLLVFFVMSFKIVAQEGDFNVRMPLAMRREGPVQEDVTPPMRLRLLADQQGNLAGIVLNERPFESLQELHYYIIGSVAGEDPAAREDVEVELDCDYDLNYENVIQAITAVSGYVDDATGEVVKLVEKIKFTPPAEAPAD